MRPAGRTVPDKNAGYSQAAAATDPRLDHWNAERVTAKGRRPRRAEAGGLGPAVRAVSRRTGLQGAPLSNAAQYPARWIQPMVMQTRAFNIPTGAAPQAEPEWSPQTRQALVLRLSLRRTKAAKPSRRALTGHSASQAPLHAPLKNLIRQ